MASRIMRQVVPVLIVLAASGCVSRSGRLDPFPAKIGTLHPSAPAVGVLRFTDAREHPDWVAPRVRSLPPPRVFFEEAALVAIQKQGMNGLILTSSPGAPAKEVAAMAAEMRLGAVLSGEVARCDQTLEEVSWWNREIRISCTIEFVLRDPRGKVLYSSSSHGEGSVRRTWRLTADRIHEAFFEAVERATSKRIDDAFAETVRRSIREAEGGKP